MDHLRFIFPMTRRALLLFLAMSVIWGISYLFIRIAVAELPPIVLVFVRTLIVAAILLPIALSRGEVHGLRRHWLPLLAFAGFEIGIPWILMSHAEQSISSSLTALLVAAVPLVGVVIATVSGNREHLKPTSIGGLLLGVVGVASIVGFDLTVSNWMALAEMGFVVVCYALGPAILARYLSDLPPVGVIAAALTACAIFYAPFAALQWPHFVPGVPVLASVAVLAIVCSALGFLLFFALVGEIGPVRATVITYVNPAVAAVLGVLVLREKFTAGMAVGFALVIIGSTLATRRPTVTAPI
jgi:drug/metabolite transporter (DMT)-like permease